MTRQTPLQLSPLDPRSAEPLYRQIYWRLRQAIGSGALKPGDRIPSARALMLELGLARGTIETAYSMLAAEGYVEANGQAGTFVSRALKPRAPVGSDAAPPGVARSSSPTFRPETTLPFQMGLPALDAFPRKVWARLAAARVRALRPADMAHPPIAGLAELRAQIASYLHVARGINCTAAQVFVTSGYHATMRLIGQALLAPGDPVWTESPGYPPTRDSLLAQRLQAVAVPVDAQGLVVDEGMRLAPRARAAVVTPAHQSPLGVSLSLPRRLALLDWARRTGSWIVEDDYDGEYRYVGRPLPALKSLDREERVLYAGTFSKVLFPGIRLAYLVVPAGQIKAFDVACETGSGSSPHLTQAILSDFIAQGHFARHIQRMRKLYAQRRTETVAVLREVLGTRAVIDDAPGGMHLILRMRGRQSDRALVSRMRAAGLYAEALSDWAGGDRLPPAILVGFTNIETRAEATALAQRVLALMR